MDTPAGSTNTTSVISLACGIGAWVALPFLLGIAAIVAGHMARAQIRREPQQQGDGMALAGLILGYANVVFCVLLLIALAVFFLFLYQAAN
jgi:uncharacterized membrane protein